MANIMFFHEFSGVAMFRFLFFLISFLVKYCSRSFQYTVPFLNSQVLCLCNRLIINVLQYAVFWYAKGGILGVERPHFVRRKVCF